MPIQDISKYFVTKNVNSNKKSWKSRQNFTGLIKQSLF